MLRRLTLFLLAATFVVVSALSLAGNTAPTGNAKVRETQTNPEIANADPTSTDADYEGFLDEADCKTIWGWVWNKNQKPNEVVSVDIWAGSSLIASIPANQPRWSVAPITGDKGNHGFSFVVPAVLKNGRRQVIIVKVARTNFELQNSPKTIKCNSRQAEGGTSQAHVD